MINNGFAIQGGQQIDYGKPFIAAFDALTGKQKYRVLVNKANGAIIDYKLIDNELYLLFKQVIAMYDIETGTLLSEKSLPKDGYCEYSFPDESRFFVSNHHGNFEKLDQVEIEKVHIYSHKSGIFAIDEQLNISYTIKYEKIGEYYLSFENYKLIANNNKTFIINNDGLIIAAIEATSNAFIIDDILYDKRDRSFVAIDLKNIISK